MRKTILSVLLSAAAVLPLSAATGITSLNAGDYSVPSWTAIQRAIAAAQPATAPFSINTTYNGDPATRMAFAWFTNQTVATGKVQLVAKAAATEADFAAATVLPAVDEMTSELNYSIDKNYLAGIEPNQKVRYMSHKALATGLEPATTYSYRVGNEGAWSEIGQFTTAASSYADGYSFIYITDTQAQNDEMFAVSAKTVHTAHQMVPDARFCLVNGDLVETSKANNSEWESEQWFATMQDVWLNLPLVPAQGNHDTSVNQNWAWHFNTDRSFDKTAMPGTVYSFVQGDALFLVINYEDWATAGYFDALATWMRQQVEAHKDVKWRIATFHKNMFTGSKSHQSDADGRKVREAMLPVFAELGINVALQGHDHIYEVLGPVSLDTKTLITGEVSDVQTVEPAGVRENMTGKQGGTFDVSQGTLFFLNNSAGKKKYEPRTEAEMTAAYTDHEVQNYWGLFSGKFGQTGEPTFSHVTVKEAEITFDTYTVDDRGNATLFDSFRVVKGAVPGAIGSARSGEAVVRYDAAARAVVVDGAAVDTLGLYTADGQTVAQSAAARLDVSAVPAGYYLVKADTKAGVLTSKIRL